MNLLSLNICGWCDSSKRRRLASIINSANFDFVCIQETKREVILEREVGMLWGNKQFKWHFEPSRGLSGGILCNWLDGVGLDYHCFSSVSYVGVRVTLGNLVVHIINVYAPCSLMGKSSLWSMLVNLKHNYPPSEWCIVGDFNAVCCLEERKGRGEGTTSNQEIGDFNSFIADMALTDVPVSGKKFSWYSCDGFSMSRLDRFLLSDRLIDLWGVYGQWIGSRDISDHCSIWLLRSIKDWGPKPFHVFNDWFDHGGFLPYVSETWAGLQVTGSKTFIIKEKLKMLKEKLRTWNRDVFRRLDLNIDRLVRDFNALDVAL